MIGRWFCGPTPARPPPPAEAKEAMIAHHAALVSIAGIRATTTDTVGTAPPKRRRGIGVLIHPMLVLTTHSTIPSPQSISDADITVCRDIRSLTYVKRKFMPQIFFETDAELDLTVVWCDIICPEVETLALDTAKMRRRALRRGHPVFVMGCQSRTPDDVAVLDGRILGLVQSSCDTGAVDFVRFQSGEDTWMPASVGFDEFGTFSFIVTEPPPAESAVPTTFAAGQVTAPAPTKKPKVWGTSVFAIKRWLEPLWRHNLNTLFHSHADSPASAANALTIKQLLFLQQQQLPEDGPVIADDRAPLLLQGGDAKHTPPPKSDADASHPSDGTTTDLGRSSHGDDKAKTAAPPVDASSSLAGADRDESDDEDEITPAPIHVRSNDVASAESGGGNIAESRERRRRDNRDAADVDKGHKAVLQRRRSASRPTEKTVDHEEELEKKRQQKQRNRNTPSAAAKPAAAEEEDYDSGREYQSRRRGVITNKERRTNEPELAGRRRGGAVANSSRFVDEEDERDDAFGGGGEAGLEWAEEDRREWMDEEELEYQERRRRAAKIREKEEEDYEEGEEEERPRRFRSGASTPARMRRKGGGEWGSESGSGGDDVEEEAAPRRRQRERWSLPAADEEERGFTLATTPSDERPRTPRKPASSLSDYANGFSRYDINRISYNGGSGNINSSSRRWMDEYYDDDGGVGAGRRTPRRAPDDEQDAYLASAAAAVQRRMSAASSGSGVAATEGGAYSKPTISYIQKRNSASAQRDAQRLSAQRTSSNRWV